MKTLIYVIGKKVWYGSVRGKIECVQGNGDFTKYGVRLENGNFKWADRKEIREREDREWISF